ncbi:MAG TPA: hypothetical protein VKB92_14350 [Myxococcales bacterium]|nr:hypothetical protein [Myxococcales bacterium]
MKVHFVTALGAAALLAACSGSNKETRTASNTANTGTSTQGSAEGTQSAAGSQGQVSTQGSTQAGTSGSATASTGSSTDTSAMGNDRSGQATTSAQNNPDTSSSSSTASPGSSTGSTYGQSGTSGGSTYGQSGTGSSGSTYGQSGTGSTSDSNMGTSGSRGSMDRSASASSAANLQSTFGRVSKVDQDNKTVVISSRQGDRITLTVDDDTQIVDNRSGNTGDLSSIREGTPVRATFDAASNRAQKIEVMSRAGRRAHKSASTDTGDPSDSKATTPNPNTAKNPAQDATGRQSPPQDQK